jgi:hypothetical protein
MYSRTWRKWLSGWKATARCYVCGSKSERSSGLKYANPGQLFKISPIISGTRRALTARPRRLRKNETMRSMLRETELNARDFIYPLFVRHGEGRTPISSMPGVYQLSPAEAVLEAEAAAQLGIPAVTLFGIPAEKRPHRAGKFLPRWYRPTGYSGD